MKPHKGLGKGLRALISETETPAESAQASATAELPIALIDPNPFQPRQVFDDAAIEELKLSIIQQGVLQPILVRQFGHRYQIIVGERRWRASRAAGLTEIPARVMQVESDEEMLEIAILENLQREDLNPVELAKALLQLQNNLGYTQERIAEKLGVSRAHIANTIRLLKLPDKIQSALAQGQLTAGHARSLLSLESDTERDELFQRFLVDGKLTVRNAENLVRKGKKKVKSHASDLFPDDKRSAQEISRIEDLLRRRLSTKVKIKPKGRGGILEIPFYTSEDLERFIEIIEA